MATFYTPKYIAPDELVDKATYNAIKKAYGNLDRVLWSFNPLVLMTADMLRERFGAITINNWSIGGSFQQRGLRIDTSTGAPYSAHRRGAALDCNFKNATAQEVRNEMKKCGCFNAGFKDRKDLNKSNGECFKYIGRVETTQNGKPITWFHFDIWNNQSQNGSVLTFGA